MMPAPGIGRPALGHQHRRGACGIQRKKRFAPLPDPFFHQTQIETVFANGKANEARMRAERMMKQREHEVLDKFTVLKKLSPRE